METTEEVNKQTKTEVPDCTYRAPDEMETIEEVNKQIKTEVPDCTYRAPKQMETIEEVNKQIKTEVPDCTYRAPKQMETTEEVNKQIKTEVPDCTYTAQKEMQRPEEVKRQTQQKSKVQNSAYKAPEDMRKTGEIKKQNQQKIVERLYEVNMKQFRIGIPKKWECTKKRTTQTKLDLDSKQPQFHPVSTSVPPFINKTKSQPIKLNRAAIQREQALHDRQLEEELQRMERLSEGAREPTSFFQWQKEMREKDLQKEVIKIRRRLVESGINEAAMARTRIMESNQINAQLKKEEKAELMQRYAEKRLQEEKEMRDLVQQVAEGHKNSKMAKERLHEYKQNIVREVSGQNRELLHQALEETQAELCRRFKVIHEINVIRSLPHAKVGNFDSTETAGHGLLSEMSLAELRERLARLKETQQEDKREKRERILEERQKEKQVLMEQLDTIKLSRRALAQAAAVRKEREKKSQMALQERLAQNETLVALERQLEEQREERQRQKQTEENKKPKTLEKTTHTVRSAESHNRKHLKEKSWKEIELSLEHFIRKTAP